VHQISVGPVQGEEVDVKQRGSVQHIASRVTGRLAERTERTERTEGAGPALAAVFRAVTASGVPKSAAYDLMRRHEPEPRVCSGAVLMVSSEGDLDAALMLRTVYRSRGRTWLRAGAGGVGESRPERAFEETCEKLRSVSRHLVPAHDSATAECQAKVSGSG
jgi:anthranilate/para-aminobenzoate synthase component I